MSWHNVIVLKHRWSWGPARVARGTRPLQGCPGGRGRAAAASGGSGRPSLTKQLHATSTINSEQGAIWIVFNTSVDKYSTLLHVVSIASADHERALISMRCVDTTAGQCIRMPPLLLKLLCGGRRRDTPIRCHAVQTCVKRTFSS